MFTSSFIPSVSKNCLGLLIDHSGQKRTEALLWCGGVHHHVSHNGVQFLFGVLVIVAAPLAANTDTVWHVLDTLAPHGFVKLRVHTHILGAHHAGCELISSNPFAYVCPFSIATGLVCRSISSSFFAAMAFFACSTATKLFSGSFWSIPC